MAVKDGWKFLLGVSPTELIGELKLVHDRQLVVDLNKSGSASGWVSMRDQLAGDIYPWSTCLVAQYTNADHEHETFWSGPINTRRSSLQAGRTTFTAVGWFERLMRLNLQDLTLEFAATDAGAIVEALLAKALLLDPRLPITMGTVELTQLRTITYQLDQSIGQAIIDLANYESGYDWEIDPVTLELNIRAVRGVDRPDVKWTFIGDGKSEHSNLSDVDEYVDGSTLTNDIRPRGRYGSGLAIDVESQAKYGGVFMSQPALGDVVDSTILNAYANAEIVYLAQPRVTYTMTPKPSTKLTVPRLFRDFDIGDTTYMTARRDFVNIVDLPSRIFGVTLSISDTGVETLTNVLTTASN